MPTLNGQLAGQPLDPTTAMILRAMAQAGSPGTAAVPRETLEEALGQPLPPSEPATLMDRLGAVASFAGNAIMGRGGVGRPRLPRGAGPAKPDVPPLSRQAIERWGLTTDLDEAGYILPGGELLDFTGRHGAVGYQRAGDRFVPNVAGTRDYLAGQRNVDHREVASLMGEKPWSPFDRTDNVGSFMAQTGAVRLTPGGANFAKQPTEAQLRAIVADARRRGRTLFVDADLPGGDTAAKEFARPTVDAVRAWLKEVLP